MRKMLFKFLRYSMLAFLFVNCFSRCDTDSGSQPNPDDKIQAPDGYILVWNDEFNGPSINPQRWEHEVNAQGGGNNELQYYTGRTENSFIEEGNLVIRAIKEQFSGPEGTREYTSARLRTKNRGDWKYGIFEIRANLPVGQGLWPAIWMLPTDWSYGGWAASGEIDIMELLGHEPHTVHGTLHFGGPHPRNTQAGEAYIFPYSFADDFHVFTLDWDTTSFAWYVDGFNYTNQTQWFSENGEYPAPFDKRFHLLLNVAVGGNWPGSPDATTVFPQEMQIDYVRVFQKKPE